MLTGIAGDLSRADGAYEIDGSYIASGNINFGSVVELHPGSTDKARAYTGSGPILGIAVRDPRKGFSRDAVTGLVTEALAYGAGDNVAILKKGSIFVTIGSGVTVTAGKQVYVVKTQGTGDPAVGSFVDADFTPGAGGAKAPLFNSYWRTGGSNTAVGEIIVNLPGGAVS